MRGERLIVFTRYPEPGAVKTRLIPAIGAQGAADLAREMTSHTLAAARRIAAEGIEPEVHHRGGDAGKMQALYGAGLAYISQEGSDLGARMHAALGRAFSSGAGKAVLIGTDCPGMDEAVLRRAFAELDDCDCVLGPARDGGYYLVGLKKPVPELFSAMPWGTGAVLERAVDVLARLGMTHVQLEELSDVDRPEDLPVWEEARQAMSLPRISVIIPTLNEGQGIAVTIRAVRTGRNVEVIVADGLSTDETASRALRAGARIVSSERSRAVQMNAGAGHATGELLVFLHADTRLPRGYDAVVRDALEDPSVAAGAFSLGFDEDTNGLRVVALGANLRSRLFGLPYGDQAFFTRRDAFRMTGGFPRAPIMEDVAFIRSMKRAGRVVIVPGRVITSARRYASLGPLKTWLLNQTAMAAYALGMPLETIAGLYRSRETSIAVWVKRLMGAALEERIHAGRKG